MTRVLIIDDSPGVRRVLARVLSSDPDVEVVGAAPDPFVARDLIVTLSPDVVTLDLELPRMDGITFLRRLMHYRPTPAVILSSLTPRGGEKALEAMRAGAVSVICKPSETYSLEEMTRELLEAVKAAHHARVIRGPPPRAALGKVRKLTRAVDKLVAIGASTGGTNAIEQVLQDLPCEVPGVVIVQHMPPIFTASFAARLDGLSGWRVREARDGDAVERGLALVAPGGSHMVVRRCGLQQRVEVKAGPLVSGHRPSVDVLFRSVAQAAGDKAVGVLLTGMGADGAKGLLELRQAGAQTLAQDEESCVVFGMPKAAIDLGAAGRVVSLERMAEAVVAGLEC